MVGIRGGWDGPEHHLLCGSCHGLSEMGGEQGEGESSPANILEGHPHTCCRTHRGPRIGRARRGARGCRVKWSRGAGKRDGTLKEERTWLRHVGGMHGDHQSGCHSAARPRLSTPPWYSVSRAGKEVEMEIYLRGAGSLPCSTRKQPGPGANNLAWTLSLQLREVTRPFDLRAA